MFGSEGTKITGNITLYAGWINLFRADVEYAISQVSIAYSAGDNPEYVTENLTLPASVEGLEGVSVTWTSNNPGTVSAQGIVNRQAADTRVKLTAKASEGSESEERDFEVIVIHQRSRTVEQAKAEIHVNGVSELRVMNEGNDDLQIAYTDNRSRVTDIEGKYADFPITNADDALDAVQSLHGILGIDDPYAELEGSVFTSDAYGAEYTFAQVWDGVRVFGRNLTVSANGDGEGDFITSDTIPSSRLNDANLNFIYSKGQAESSAVNYYSGSFDVRTEETDKVIFTLEDYEDNPVPTYVVYVYGVDDEDEYRDENIFVNALNGEVIYSTTNIHSLSRAVMGWNELDTLVVFSVEPMPDFRNDTQNTIYYMFDPDTKVVVHDGRLGSNASLQTIVGQPAGNVWSDAQQVSAYINMIEIMKWWRASFDRDSLDGKGMYVHVITHQRLTDLDENGEPYGKWRDNAFWWSYKEKMYICDPSDDLRSNAASIEVLTHESTHAVLWYMLDKGNFPYQGATGAINEGYADIFGCLKTGQWLCGRDVHANGTHERNIASPADPVSRQNINNRLLIAHAPLTYSERYQSVWWYRFLGLKDDNGGVHINSSLISYPAYLMHKDHVSGGLTWQELGRLWYKSMRMGYSAASDFFTVRRCVLRAARKLNMPEEKIDIIKQAFEDVGIVEEKCVLQGTVSEYNGRALSNIRVTANKLNSGIMYMSVLTDAEGRYSMDLYEDTYTINIEANGYVPFNAVKEVQEGVDNIVNISLVTPTGAHTSTITGTVRDALTSDPVGGGVMKIWKGWNVHKGYTVAETLINDNGTYDLSLYAGYYTVEYSREGSITTSINNFVISSDETLKRDVIHVPATDDKYRVTLQWDRNPKYLDSHLIGPITGTQGTFHVYYVDRTAYDTSGNVIAIIEQDDTRDYGFETITFEMKPFDKFRYYVHWWSKDYSTTWKGTNAIVNLYKGAQLINTFTVPQVNENGYWKYWHVFDITEGFDPVQPSLSESITNTEPSINN